MNVFDIRKGKGIDSLNNGVHMRWMWRWLAQSQDSKTSWSSPDSTGLVRLEVVRRFYRDHEVFYEGQIVINSLQKMIFVGNFPTRSEAQKATEKAFFELSNQTVGAWLGMKARPVRAGKAFMRKLKKK